MKAAIALVPDVEFQNRCNRLTIGLLKYGFGLLRLRLPVHISLKQPFDIPSVERIERYFYRLAEHTASQEIHLNGFYYFGDLDRGVISLYVVETDQLRLLHEKLNVELEHEFGGTQADFDGADYHFHLTLSLGRPQPERYEQMRNDLQVMEFDEKITMRELALYLYDEDPDARWEYGVFKVLPLTGE